jgi:Na+/melibiose symporter-like transporter
MTTSYGNTTTTPAKTSSNGLAIAGMVCGIVGIFLFSVILGPLAVIFGGAGLRNARRGARHHGMALAAVILGVFDIVLFIVMVAVVSNTGGFSWHVG